MSGRRDLPNFWSRSHTAKQVASAPIFPDEPPAPRRIFVASFENDPSKPPMNLLLGWEYGRIWLRERDEYLKETSIKTKNKFIKPDFSWWIAKRAIVSDRRKLFKNRLDDQQSAGKASLVSATPELVEKQPQPQQQRPIALVIVTATTSVGKQKSNTKLTEKSKDKNKKSKRKTTAATAKQTKNNATTTASNTRIAGGGVNVVASGRRNC